MTVTAPTTRPVRVRIAPSPTGDPHIGTAYMSLFNYVFAKQQGGKFILRIEDTDRTRYRADSEQLIFDALKWCGLPWDEGPDVGGPHAPYRQSERTHIYREHADKLLASGAAYRCFCSEERLEKMRLLQEASSQKGYDRLCRKLDRAESDRRAAAGEIHVIRQAMPTDGVVRFVDQFRGEQAIDAAQLNDHVLMKSDGFPTYHLAAIVDDTLMEISHVVRGEEWLSSTPMHVVLFRALGVEPPIYCHMPLLRNADGSKISKRKNPTSIFYYRDLGLMPEAFRNYLGTLGWSFGGDREKFTLEEMTQVFSWDRISLGGPVFDVVKLTALNEKYIHELTDEQLADRIVAWRFNREHLLKLMPLAHKRIKRFDELIPLVEYFYTSDLDYAPVIADMKIDGVKPEDLADAVVKLVEKYDARVGWVKADLEADAKAWAAEQGWKPKQAYPIIRFALTARHASPGLFDVLEVLGKEIGRRRLRQAAAAIAATATA